jgi:hypothetical protein
VHGGAVCACDLGRPVFAPIVNHQDFDLRYPWDLTWQRRQGGSEAMFLIEAGDLDDKLHDAGPLEVALFDIRRLAFYRETA